MIIKLLQDNSVTDEAQVINSTHSHKANNPLVKAIADLLPYKGAMEFSPDAIEPVFDDSTCAIRAGDKTLTPDSNITAEPAEVQAFHKAIYGELRDSRYAEICRLKCKEERGTVYKTETVMESQPEIEVVDGKAVMRVRQRPVEKPIEQEIPVVDESGSPVIDPETKKQRMHKVPVIDEAKSFTERDKARLAALVRA